MNFEADKLDEDLRLAIHLSEIESPSLRRSQSKSSFEGEDYEYALKLSKALNSPRTSNPDLSTFSSHNSQSTELFLMNKFSNWKDKMVPFERCSSLKNDYEDYSSAVEFTDEELKDSSCVVRRNEPQNGRLNKIVESDFEIAIRLAEKVSCIKSSCLSGRSSRSYIELAEANSSKPAIDSEIPHKNLVTSQLLEMNNLNVRMNAEFTAVTNRSRAGDNESKEVPKNSDSSAYMNKTMSVVDPSWEMTDPNPDIHALFIAFNRRFFWGKLDMVEVKWSLRMTLCAGICSYQRRAGHCVIKLSKPLLSYRPRRDLVETLLHEMIHAYLFVTNKDRDRDGHGVHFHQHMYRINRDSGSNITVYHSFHEEVRMYKTHVWRCDGPCRDQKPFFGFVKRSMNRVPGPNDLWWAEHSASCSGKFHKIKEPEKSQKKKGKKSTKFQKGKKADITKFLIKSSASTSNSFSGAGTSFSS